MNWISTFLFCVVPFTLLNAVLSEDPPMDPRGLYNQLAEVIDEAAENMNYFQTYMLHRRVFEIVRRKKQERNRRRKEQEMRRIKELNQDKVLESPDEDNDCVEEDYKKPNLFDFMREQAVIGSVTDFPSVARDERNSNIYIAASDSNDQRSGGINIPLVPKKKICKKNSGYRKIGGYGQDPRKNSNSYLLVRLQ